MSDTYRNERTDRRNVRLMRAAEYMRDSDSIDGQKWPHLKIELAYMAALERDRAWPDMLGSR